MIKFFSYLRIKNFCYYREFKSSDNFEIAYKAGIAGVIQPGGSIKDKEIINKVNDLGMFTPTDIFF